MVGQHARSLSCGLKWQNRLRILSAQILQHDSPSLNDIRDCSLIYPHYDGFCMFDSSYTDYKITNTPKAKISSSNSLRPVLAVLCHLAFTTPPDLTNDHNYKSAQDLRRSPIEADSSTERMCCVRCRSKRDARVHREIPYGSIRSIPELQLKHVGIVAG
jgi:hypothetical protein